MTHICPSGKCALGATDNTGDSLGDGKRACVAPRGLTGRPERQSGEADQPHPPTQDELATFWRDEPINTHPEGTQE